jgi:hypothetical protein
MIKESIMFKKSVLAIAVASVASQGQAATWDTGGAVKVIHGVEETTGTSELTGVPITNALVRLGAEYAINDTVTFTYDVAKATNASYPNSITSLVPSNSEGVAACAALTGAVTTTAATTLVLSSTKCSASAVAGDLISVDSQTLRVMSVAGAIVTLAESFTGSVAAGTAAVTFLNPKGIALGLQSSTATSATYRIASFSGTGSSTINSTIAAPLPNASPAGLVAAGTTGQRIAFSASGPTDALATKHAAAGTVSEFAFTTVTAFDGIVDVEDGKKTFTTTDAFNGGTATDKTDAWEYTLLQTAVTDGKSISGTAAPVTVTALDVAIASTVLTIPGDWSYLDSDATTAGIQLTAAGNVMHADNAAGGQEAGVVNSFSATGDLVMTAAAGGMVDADLNEVGIVSAVANAVLPAIDFAPTMTLTYTTDEAATPSMTLSPAISAGAWTLNGASISVYGVPYGDTVSRFLWVNNKGATSGPVTATLTSGGSTYGPYVLPTAAAGLSSTEVGSQIDTALAGAGVTLPASSRANVVLTVPVKAVDVTVSAAYKHIGDADRLALETSDSLDTTTK